MRLVYLSTHTSEGDWVNVRTYKVVATTSESQDNALHETLLVLINSIIENNRVIAIRMSNDGRGIRESNYAIARRE